MARDGGPQQSLGTGDTLRLMDVKLWGLMSLGSPSWGYPHPESCLPLRLIKC